MSNATPAIIPARGGSKGIPRKNLKLLEGKPLIVWTIEQVLATRGLTPYVSTEDAEIADVARGAGAQVIERPDELAGDTTASEPVIEHAIEVITAEVGRPDQVMFLQATSPLRLPGTLARCLDEFAVTGADSMVGVVPAEIFMWRRMPQVEALYPYEARPRRQDLTPDQLRYRETGSLYLTRTEIYEKHHNRLGGSIELFVMDPLEGIDIDAEHDFTLAESLWRRMSERGA
ncbi:acylneuraminate cytidylyltransferase family protein [Dermacoccus nishinomiyaensis]|uniref:acylneuraminate cytidylyltransferase family protein n=1 Tax=Dermacoccus nishinomiyaensis TaxID=1274 RepID=UPI000E056302|nr:acylneuraminate cytidylyltransferase family protein [Dermacoccus nishinomiyaensis]QQY24200.1 acylneuraminate cytidylyltransferase family protein [Dermacoccus nishinomiyaensis]STD71258.1 N-acylneuraminate cytidylyltransferase [Dermacoccus nishinomiyaensis]